jgi:hypothetical protein
LSGECRYLVKSGRQPNLRRPGNSNTSQRRSGPCRKANRGSRGSSHRQGGSDECRVVSTRRTESRSERPKHRGQNCMDTHFGRVERVAKPLSSALDPDGLCINRRMEDRPTMPGLRASLLAYFVAAAFPSRILHAEPIPVRCPQGSAHGFLVLKTLEGKRIATGDVAHNPRLSRRLPV